MSGGDIPWVSLCGPTRPGKNSLVAFLRIRIPPGPLSSRLVPACAAVCLRGSPTRGYITLPTGPPLVADMSLIWDMKTHHVGVAGGWAACAQSPVTGGLPVCVHV